MQPDSMQSSNGGSVLSMSEDKVDFFFVGFPKSGSTTFYYLLKSHPEIFSPDVKEFDFFMTDFNQEARKHLGENAFQLTQTEEDYSAFFRCEPGKIKGDFTPSNIFSQNAPQDIFRYNPEAKILVSIREPISFLRSYHFQFLYNMIEDEPDFLKALSLEESRRMGQHIPKYCYTPYYLYYSSLVEYKEHVQRYTDIFGYDQVKIILFDDLLKNEMTVYQDILRFLNVRDAGFIPPKPERNASHMLRFAWLRGLVFSPPIKKWLYTITPRKLMPVGAKISQAIFKKKQEKPFVSEVDIHRLKTRFRPNVVELNSFLNDSRLIDRNLLTLWNY